ncbi:hypothetical protein D9599_08495 [Roseomonas sp. KE2513]|uniref:hypothetical protein n=1 Tax=Roseomonas sp. KE2513 TaxID=2479202 RepID=UPI0018DF030F|nr:hypothetical protein [Roseomonas sp. KE2513]MBI0535609.1 hypothetical protein [Roseomonas sp. KE2513]
MFSFSFSKSLRTLGLAAVAVSPLIAGSAFAEGFDGRGPTALSAWTHSEARTPLAATNPASAGASQQSYLQRSGATGGQGQGS